MKLIRRWQMCCLIGGFLLTGSAQAWDPPGWTWWRNPYAYEEVSESLYWLEPEQAPWVYVIPPATGGWQTFASSGLARGWSWWVWPSARMHWLTTPARRAGIILAITLRTLLPIPPTP